MGNLFSRFPANYGSTLFEFFAYFPDLQYGKGVYAGETHNWKLKATIEKSHYEIQTII